ncbi:DUF3631 domain-containing protein [Mycolicibacter arupensis]|uniref:DUF3631 domain-containing protein n=1 Tax=Mycolicibacter arupensis TaxID=342002 RepID=UPI0023F042C2|nr:DUF3631 domain-containing protein [Mycolicibacter arupensis]
MKLTEAVEPIDGAELLDAIYDYLRTYVAYPNDWAGVLHTLWIAHTHLMDVWDSTPRLAFMSAEPGSGKSRALEVTEPLVPRPVHAVNVTPAYLFRKVSDPAGAPTILYDEIDTVFGPKAKDNEDIRGMLNAGHRRGATAGRCVVRGKQIDTEDLPAYCAVAVAGLKDLPDTLASRAVLIRMRRRAPGETVKPWREREGSKIGHALRGQLADWADQVRDSLIGTYPAMPPELTDRVADVAEALLAVADVAGGEWPLTGRVAAVAAVAASSDNRPSRGVRLLSDIRDVFQDTESVAISTELLLENLRGLEDSEWGVYELSAYRLSRSLAEYDICPSNHRFGKRVKKGYSRADFADAWSRYLPEAATSATPATDIPDTEGEA